MEQEKKKKTSLDGGPKIKVKRGVYFRTEDYLRLYDEGVMPEEDEEWSDVRREWIEEMRLAIMRHRPECRNPKMVAMMTFGIYDYSNYKKGRKGKEPLSPNPFPQSALKR